MACSGVFDVLGGYGFACEGGRRVGVFGAKRQARAQLLARVEVELSRCDLEPRGGGQS